MTNNGKAKAQRSQTEHKLRMDVFDPLTDDITQLLIQHQDEQPEGHVNVSAPPTGTTLYKSANNRTNGQQKIANAQ